MNLVTKLKNPQQRFFACIAFACAIHGLGLISFHLNAPANTAKQHTVIDILLTPQELSNHHEYSEFESPTKSELKNRGTTPFSIASSALDSTPIFKTSNDLRKRAISANHHEPQDAEYLARWQAYIEDIGNQHYAENSSSAHLKGNLRLMVSVNKDGTLKDIDLRQSSGNALLDKTAISIVLKAAPFEPFPTEISNEVDVLDIIRTWQFNGIPTANS